MKKNLFNNSLPAFITLTTRTRHMTRSVVVYTKAQADYITKHLTALGRRVEVTYHYNTQAVTVAHFASVMGKIDYTNMHREEKVYTLNWSYMNGKLRHILKRYSVVRVITTK